VTQQTTANPWKPDQLKFQAWLALPSSERHPKTQKQFAQLLEVHETTLCDWKRLPGWHEAVYELALNIVVGELTPIMYAQVREAKKGSLPHAQWLFDLEGKWSPKQKIEQEHTGRIRIDQIEVVTP
jgi:hypothetical protein